MYFCSQLYLACRKTGCPQMHGTIKMFLVSLLTALCLCAFPGHPGPVASHKVFDMVLPPTVLQDWGLFSTSSRRKQRAWGGTTDAGETNMRAMWALSRNSLPWALIFSWLLWVSVFLSVLRWRKRMHLYDEAFLALDTEVRFKMETLCELLLQ